MDTRRFLLLDRAVRIDRAAKRIECEAIVPRESELFEGHFPGFEIFPGVLQVELIAQASGLLVLLLEDMLQTAIMVGIERVRFRNLVRPGTTLRIRTSLIAQGSGYAVCGGSTITPDGIAAAAEIRFRVMDFPTPLFRDHALAMAHMLCASAVEVGAAPVVRADAG